VKKYKRYLLAALSLSALLLLTGCVSIDKTTKQPTGFVWNLIGKPMGEAINFFATDLGLGFGLGIILVTVIVRVIIFPLGIYQSWKATYQSEKMNYLKPIFAPIQERIKNAKTQEEKLMANQDLMMAQRENGVSPFGGIGCLPLLIQMPILLALFQALSNVDFLKTGHFLWFNLGGADTTFVLPILAALFTFLSSWLSNKALPEKNGAMTGMMYGMPVIIFFFAISAPSGVALYWAVSNAYQVLQTYLLNNPFKIIAEREADVQAKKDIEVKKRKALKKAQKKKK